MHNVSINESAAQRGCELSTRQPEAAHRAFIDEQAIAVLRLPLNASPQPHGIPRYLALARDAGRPWRCLMPQIFDWPYGSEIIQTVCVHRAVLTVDGRLRLARRQVTPETYLRRWRRAIETAGDITLWRTLNGVKPIARFKLDTCVLSSAELGHWRQDPYDLPSLLNAIVANDTGVLIPGEALGHSGNVDDGSLLESSDRSVPTALHLAIDLTHPDGACHAWWTQLLLERVPQAISTCAMASTIEMSRLGGESGEDLYATTRAAQRALLQRALGHAPGHQAASGSAAMPTAA